MLYAQKGHSNVNMSLVEPFHDSTFATFPGKSDNFSQKNCKSNVNITVEGKFLKFIRVTQNSASQICISDEAFVEKNTETL